MSEIFSTRCYRGDIDVLPEEPVECRVRTTTSTTGVVRSHRSMVNGRRNRSVGVPRNLMMGSAEDEKVKKIRNTS